MFFSHTNWTIDSAPINLVWREEQLWTAVCPWRGREDESRKSWRWNGVDRPNREMEELNTMRDTLCLTFYFRFFCHQLRPFEFWIAINKYALHVLFVLSLTHSSQNPFIFLQCIETSYTSRDVPSLECLSIRAWWRVQLVSPLPPYLNDYSRPRNLTEHSP